MPSDAVTTDDRVALALEALAGPRADFRSAVAETIDAATALLDARGSAPEERVARTGVELGAFARGRIDAEAFAGLFAVDDTLDPAAVVGVRRARETLRAIAAAGEDAFRVNVEPGSDLRDAVGRALAGLGRAFAAGRAIERIVERRPGAGDASGIESLPYAEWTGGERAVAPPLVVEVDGADLSAAGLAEFLDGTARFVLVVRGPSPPAPLARLVTPSTTVLQTDDPGRLEIVAESTGPAVAALVPAAAARFVHDPAGGPSIADRLTLEFVPEDGPRVRLGGASAFQQAEELRHLVALAAGAGSLAPPVAGPGTAPKGAPALPADRLAAWLLSRADWTGVEEGNGAG